MDTTIQQDNAWKKKYFAYLSSQIISFFGTSLVQYAIVWYITLKTGSGVMVTLIMMCSFIPQLIISLFAGVWADRYNRKMLIMLSDGMIAFTTLVLAILFLFGIDSYWLLFIVAAMRSLGAGIQSPASSAMLPQLIPKDKMMKMSGLKHTVESIMLLVSPAVSGALLSFMGLVSIFFVDVITAAIAIIVLFFVKVKAYKETTESSPNGYFGDMKIGLSYIKNHKFLVTLFTYIGLFMFLVVPVAYLSPLMIKRSFGGEVWRLTANEILFSLGTLIGGILITTWGGFKNRIVTIATACICFGVFTIAIGIVPTFAIGVVPTFLLFLILVALSGIFVPFMTVSSTVIIQESVEEGMLGRVFSVFQIVLTAVMPLGTLVFGPLSDYVSIQMLCIITGILMLIVGVATYFNKTTRHISYKPEKKQNGLKQTQEEPLIEQPIQS